MDDNDNDGSGALPPSNEPENAEDNTKITVIPMNANNDLDTPADFWRCGKVTLSFRVLDLIGCRKKIY